MIEEEPEVLEEELPAVEEVEEEAPAEEAPAEEAPVEEVCSFSSYQELHHSRISCFIKTFQKHLDHRVWRNGGRKSYLFLPF